MIIVRNVNVSLDDYKNLKECCAKALKTDLDNIASLKIIKKSIDARKKQDVHFVYSFLVELKSNEARLCRNCKNAEPYTEKTADDFLPLRSKGVRPLIIGSGPAGLFCALELVKYGYTPIIIERGCPVEQRVKDVDSFISSSVLNEDSNVQFGEGGAGTFSDGKLNTGISSVYRQSVLESFVLFGANEDILYDLHPHIGTDVLRNVIVNMRNYLSENGVDYMFNTKLLDFKTVNGKITHAIVNRNGAVESIECDCLVLAIGHSARDTFKMLKGNRVQMEQKNFAIGVRIEHLNEIINKGRYGRFYNHPALEAASYNLSAQVNGEGLFTFCMCPGGVVVPATNVTGSVVTNGMSYRARDGVNSNSALLVGVGPNDFADSDVLAGVDFQEKIEESAFRYSDSYRAPCQRFGDLAQNLNTTSFGDVSPSYSIGAAAGNIGCCLPKRVVDVIRDGIPALARQLPGFDHPDAILTAPETRTSSPVRILRDETMQSNILGLYPCGEGAGYAGGITSSAIDGIKVARAIMAKK